MLPQTAFTEKKKKIFGIVYSYNVWDKFVEPSLQSVSQQYRNLLVSTLAPGGGIHVQSVCRKCSTIDTAFHGENPASGFSLKGLTTIWNCP